ncbi:MAG TPA: HAMP domain-containing sensor histidine kinase [Solirubrobacteraceae bacterium]|jgi:signal transduction histidine kinase|nr:HAMP domain-containing sensor histidine kinase [Solirubrobacteraceae bacterium]
MSVIASPHSRRSGQRPSLLRRYAVEIAWAAFTIVCHAAMILWPDWQTIPFFLIWISLALVYGLRVWDTRTTLSVLLLVTATSATTLTVDVITQHQDWKMLFKVPLMAALVLVMVWHARGRVGALRASEHHAAELHAALERQERFIHDASHELKTPVTIARGHLELLRSDGKHDVEIALDELRRIDAILGQLLLLATAGQPNFLRVEPIALEAFLEDVFMRWSDVAPRSWRLGAVVRGTVQADPDRLRTALDALLDNAVKYSDEHSAIELRARWGGQGEVVIEVEDEGIGISRDAIGRIFARFGRADAARTRSAGGVGLGLAIVEAIADHHGGHCTVQSGPHGSVFSLHLPVAATAAGELLESSEQPLTSSVFDL